MSADHPIIFSGPMVQAILDGRKSQTRRLMKPQPKVYPGYEGWRWPVKMDGYAVIYGSEEPERWLRYCPYGQPSDHLWVREAHAIVPATAYRASEGVVQTVNPHDTYYAAIYRQGFDRANGCFGWRPSIHMPRWASRISLRVVEVRVQRLQEISEEDALAEGLPEAPANLDPLQGIPWLSARERFQGLWDDINAKPDRTWEDNPWVWIVGFERKA